ncbi:unnamed protein product [Didymodactylos carnosus]|uniref:Uncharacterized protein n=1 Tax=Didymodactylos carnosus TaxID=1234261 RepID=A0A814GAW4_9BILA|nr:unnamed protein product [Didymodactylos carnosus]CAF0994017.1 unnamed protein product [Didymodactylos carnosus]CAF3658806.1 unnamed protein product [Didymodactylos carnosus]CAF3765773.1 unnamed protein product [Didymodactylos carnosus]
MYTNSSFGNRDQRQQTSHQKITNNNNNMNIQKQQPNRITKFAFDYATDKQSQSFKIECNPKVEDAKQGSKFIQEFIGYVKTDFLKQNSVYSRAVQFDIWWIDLNGNMQFVVKFTELYVYLCNDKRYPKKIMNIKLTPNTPKHLPPQHTAILKWLKHSVTIEDVKEELNSKFISLFTIEKMMGTAIDKNRHIRIEICNKSGNTRKLCQNSTFDICKRCGGDDSTDEDGRNSIKMSSQPSPEAPAVRQNHDYVEGDDEAFRIVHHQRRRLQPREAPNDQFFDATTSPLQTAVSKISKEAERFSCEFRFPPVKISFINTNVLFTDQIARQSIGELKRRNVRTRNLVSFWRIDSTKKYFFVYADNREAFSRSLMNETYPRSINVQQFNIEQAKRIPPQMSVLAMGVSCQLSEAEVITDVQEQYASVDVVLFVCPASSRTRNAKVNFRDNLDYTKCLNNGFIYVNHLKLTVKRYLGTPRVMLCSKYQGFGRFRARCTSAHEYCAVCSAERSLDSPHVCTNVTKRGNCCSDHSYTYSQYFAWLQYRRELIEQLLEKNMVSNHVHIPEAFKSRVNRVFPLTPVQNRVHLLFNVTL